MLLTTEDFIDKYELSTGMYDTAKLEFYIGKYSERYLLHLMGAELFTEFENDLSNNVPQSPNFLKIWEPFNQDVSSVSILGHHSLYGYRLNGILESDGILEMLKGFIYFEYSKDLMNQQTPFGNVKQRAENSVVVDSPHTLIFGRYNEAIRTYRAIQEYIYTNQNLPLGQLVTFDLTTAGTGYVDGTFSVSGGSGAGAEVTIVTTAGVIDSVTISLAGSDYTTGDILTIDSGNLDGTITLTKVGGGDFSKFNGANKSNAYWI